jgi:hypothetical protein
VSDDVAAQVRAVIDEVGDLSRLAPLKERLPDEISYDELRCVVEAVKRQRQEAWGSAGVDDTPHHRQ